MRTILLVLTMCLLAQPAMPESYSGYGLITELTVGVSWARVKTTDMGTPSEGCSSTTWYILQDIKNEGREMYAALLAAKASAQPVRLQLNGCYSNYSKITHVYVAD
jgi:hypothetical protein